MKIALVSANMAGIDSKKSIAMQSIDCDYYLYNDKNCPLPLSAFDARMKAKYFKCQAHKLLNHDVIIWVDGNVEIKSEKFVETMVAKLKGKQLVISEHPARSCIYSEANFITDEIKSKNHYLTVRYGRLPIQEEAEYYRQHGHPENAGLWYCGVFARATDEKTNSFFDAWWEKCLQWSAFDQNSFAFLMREQKLKTHDIHFGDFYENPFFKIHSHLKIA